MFFFLLQDNAILCRKSFLEGNIRKDFFWENIREVVFFFWEDIRKAFLWENIRTFLILELERPISRNVRNFFRDGFFKFLSRKEEILLRKCTRQLHFIVLRLFFDILEALIWGVSLKKRSANFEIFAIHTQN